MARASSSFEEAARASAPPKLSVGVPEAAEMIGISTRTAWTEIAEGRLRSFKARGRRLVRVSQIEAYLDRRDRTPTPSGAEQAQKREVVS